VLLAITSVPAFLMLLARRTMTESPRFLVGAAPARLRLDLPARRASEADGAAQLMRGRTEEARAALMAILEENQLPSDRKEKAAGYIAQLAAECEFVDKGSAARAHHAHDARH
jgi:hypothetical protein